MIGVFVMGYGAWLCWTRRPRRGLTLAFLGMGIDLGAALARQWTLWAVLDAVMLCWLWRQAYRVLDFEIDVPIEEDPPKS